MNPAARPLSRRALEALLNAGLQAARQGQALALAPRHRRLGQWLEQSWLPPVLGTLGDLLPPAQRRPAALQSLLHWALSQLRPDRHAGFDDMDQHAWLQSTSWRPMLALACYHGLLQVPQFPSHYRRRENEGAVDNLCGLWSVGASTLYRYMDKGKRQLAEQLVVLDASGERLMGLRDCVHQQLARRPPPVEGWPTWHARQAQTALTEGRPMDALWHQWQADDLQGSLTTLSRHSAHLAASAETDALVALWSERRPEPTVAFETALGSASLWRHRQDSERELEAVQRALRVASELGSDLLCGRAYAAFGRLYEQRDPDRSLACFDDSLQHLQRATSEAAEPERSLAVADFARVLAHLAWLQLRRNDPKARTLLEQVNRLAQNHVLGDDIKGEIEQVWGEYWRCMGDLPRALEHKHRALNIFQRIGDRRAELTTYNNLSLIYGEARDTPRAVEYGSQVLMAAENTDVEPEVLAGALGNLGVAWFYQGDLDQAISHYARAVDVSKNHGLRRHLVSGHYNLAEAYFHRFAKSGDPADERQGDHHAGLATRLGMADNQSIAEASRTLKGEVLGDRGQVDRLLPAEFAEHFEAMAEVQRLRQQLAVPDKPEVQVRLRLGIARAYQAIATQEREAALTLAAKHGLTEDFSEELSALRGTFEQAVSARQRTLERWKREARDLMDEQCIKRVLAQLYESGALSKSSYTELAQVSPATASKHLGMLAERGLLLQSGKGPSTRYKLPD
jgi:tetratricopeptide (TPR) repeat protein/DNA-binding transcriptional ArsR family regulator